MTAGTVDPACTVDPAFTAVRDVVADVLRETVPGVPGLGASLCVVVHGRVVADLWGGFADVARTRPWRRDTVVNLASAGKGAVACALHRLVARGDVDLDAPVHRYWPSFADKDDVLVRHVLGHQSGLAALRDPLPADAIFDWGRMTSALAAETPWWKPGTKHGYHAVTFGFLVGELVRRVDGRTVGRVLRDDVCRDNAVFVGWDGDERGEDVAEVAMPVVPKDGFVPKDVGKDVVPRDVGEDVAPKDVGKDVVPKDVGEDAVPKDVAEDVAKDVAPKDVPRELTLKAFANPPLSPSIVNTARWRRAEVPASNATGHARGLAGFYASLLAGDVLPDDVLSLATSEASAGVDEVLGMESRFSLGFMLPSPMRPFGPPGRTSAGAPSSARTRCFGHSGAGGVLGFADPDAGLAFGFATNALVAAGVGGDPRWPALIDAVYASLRG